MKKNDVVLQKATRESDRFVLRLPDGLRDRIAEEAKKNGRSMNTEILSCISAQLGCEPARLTSLAETLQASVDALIRRLDEK